MLKPTSLSSMVSLAVIKIIGILQFQILLCYFAKLNPDIFPIMTSNMNKLYVDKSFSEPPPLNMLHLL